MRTFFQELKRRRVYRVALAYAIAASAAVQLVGTILPAFHAPDWIFQILLLLLALGFPAALVLSWVFDLSHRGLSRTTAANGLESTDHRRLAVLGLTGLLFAALAVTAYWFWHPWRTLSPPPSASDIPAAVASPAISDKSIAVIPFANLSDDKEDNFFAEGVQDEIITDLARVADLKVISRTSVMQYRPGAERNIREISKALGVAYILEGTVQRDGRHVRMSAQLIDARTDTHIWAERYERDLDDLFALQSKLAETIAEQLATRISPAEKAAIEEKRTSDADAHDLYLRANALISGPLFNLQGNASLLEAVNLLKQAVARDPNYLLAWCRLARANDQLYLTGGDRTPDRLARAEVAIQAAQRLRPDAGETHLARAEHLYCGFLAYDDARRELEIASHSLPNEPAVFELAGFIDRRQGQWEDSIRNLARALELEPLNTSVMHQLAVSYFLLRRYEDAAILLDRALRILPNDTGLQVARAGLDLHARGDSRPLHNTIAAIVAKNPRDVAGLADEWFVLALCERDDEAAGRALQAMTATGYNNEAVRFSRSWCQALAARTRGDAAGASSAFALARTEIQRSLQDEPDRAESLSVLAMIDAALGRKDEAINGGRRAVQLLPATKDAINGPLIAEYLAVTYAWVGEREAALEQLKIAVKLPSDLSYGQLKLHPFWDSLRGDPEFEKIVVELAPK